MEGYRRLTGVSPSSNRSYNRIAFLSRRITISIRPEFANRSSPWEYLFPLRFDSIKEKNYYPQASKSRKKMLIRVERSRVIYIYIYLKVHWIIPVTRVCRWLFILESRMQRLLILSTLFCSRVLCFFKLRSTFPSAFPSISCFERLNL